MDAADRGQTTFEQQFTAHPNINAVVTPNDDNANAVIAVLQKHKIPPKTFPTTGQDASPSGLQNILKGYQCGTVYKPIYLEAQAAAALALYLRAGETPPAALVNATTDGLHERQGRRVGATRRRSGSRPTTWPTPSSRTAPSRSSDLCAGQLASACTAAGIKLARLDRQRAGAQQPRARLGCPGGRGHRVRGGTRS